MTKTHTPPAPAHGDRSCGPAVSARVLLPNILRCEPIDDARHGPIIATGAPLQTVNDIAREAKMHALSRLRFCTHSTAQ
jgi:hypothetical protein